MTALWLFLYLGTLVQLLMLFRLDLNRPTTLLMLLPILLLPLMDRICRQVPALIGPTATRIAGILALGSALVLARALNLGFWDTTRPDLAGLFALLGLCLSFIAQARPGEGGGPGPWIWIAAWELAGTWHPILPVLGAGVAGCLLAFGAWPGGGVLQPSVRRLPAFGVALLLGLVLPKPSFDFQFGTAWPAALACFALGAGLTGLPSLRKRLDRLPNALVLVLLALAFVVYSSAWVLAWGLAVGLIWGVLWSRLPRPLSRTRLSFGLLLGMLLSFALHSNLGIPLLRRVLWWGS